MANASILAAFERMWQHVVTCLNGKSDNGHSHDDKYYTQAEVNALVDETKEYVDELIGDLLNGAS